jgi:B12 binding domain
MPHLWMFLLKSLTPWEHEVLLIDGNAKPMNEQQLVRFARKQIGLAGIGAMTRTIARAYSFADALRAAGIPVVMGGSHVTELPAEALGHDGGPRHADAVALGEADETWPKIVADAAQIYELVDKHGKERKPSLKEYPVIPWDTIDLEYLCATDNEKGLAQFDLSKPSIRSSSCYEPELQNTARRTIDKLRKSLTTRGFMHLKIQSFPMSRFSKRPN